MPMGRLYTMRSMEKHIGYYMECHLAVLFEKDVDDAFD